MNSLDYPVSGCAGYACGFMIPCTDTIAQQRILAGTITKAKVLSIPGPECLKLAHAH